MTKEEKSQEKAIIYTTPWCQFCKHVEAYLDEKKYPYELNSQRPLSELMANIPEMQGRWELTRGGKARAEILWQPVLELWRLYLKQIVR